MGETYAGKRQSGIAVRSQPAEGSGEWGFRREAGVRRHIPCGGLIHWVSEEILLEKEDRMSCFDV